MAREKVAIFHGKPPKERYDKPHIPKPHIAGWIGWAGVELTLQGLDVTIPKIAQPYLAQFPDWLDPIHRFAMDGGRRVIGHSYGFGALLRYATHATEAEFDHIVGVAPWLNPNNDGKYPFAMMDFAIDRELLLSRCAKLDIFYDPEDDDQVRRSMDRLHTALPEDDQVAYHVMPGYGHFLMGNNMQSPEFTQLVETVTAA